jgi:hypothetical protein
VDEEGVPRYERVRPIFQHACCDNQCTNIIVNSLIADYKLRLTGDSN